MHAYICIWFRWSWWWCLFSCSVVSFSLLHHELKHSRMSHPPLPPSVCSNSCPSRQRCHPTVSSSVHPLLLLPSIFPSISIFSSRSALCIKWPKYWSFSFNISPSNEYSELISFSIDQFNLLAVYGALKSVLQHNFKPSILQW